EYSRVLGGWGPVIEGRSSQCRTNRRTLYKIPCVTVTETDTVTAPRSVTSLSTLLLSAVTRWKMWCNAAFRLHNFRQSEARFGNGIGLGNGHARKFVQSRYKNIIQKNPVLLKMSQTNFRGKKA